MWEEIHKCASFLPNPEMVENLLKTLTTTMNVDHPSIHDMNHEILSKVNLGNISKTIFINISIKTGFVENIHTCVECSLQEIENYTMQFPEWPPKCT